MSKSMFTLAAALAAVALAPLAAASACAASLPSIHDEADPDFDNCNLEVPNDTPLASGRVVAVDHAAGRITLDYRPSRCCPKGAYESSPWKIPRRSRVSDRAIACASKSSAMAAALS